MSRIKVPPGMGLTAVICVEKVSICEHGPDTEFHVDGFTKSNFGDITELGYALNST